MMKAAKRILKYHYYRSLCALFGKNKLTNNGIYAHGDRKAESSSVKSAVFLKVKGKIEGVGYKKWVMRKARANKVQCWVNRRGKKRANILLVGQLENILIVAQSAWKGPQKAKVKSIEERWFYKRDSRATEAVTPVGDTVNRFTITFAGDTSLGDYYLKKYRDGKMLDRLENEPISFFKGLKPLTDNSDHFIINLETVLADNPQSSLGGKEYPNWDNPERTISVLKQLGVTSVSLANNHTMDFGPKVMLRTCDQLKRAGIKIFGAGTNIEEASAPLKLELKGKWSTKKVYIFNGMRASKRYWDSFCFFADEDTAGVNPLDLDKLIFTIADLRQQEPDALIIVCPHWQGSDYKWVSPKMVDICRSLIVAGADYVFAHGTHTANHIEKTNKGTIAFSIGNFVFNSPGRYKKLNALPYSMIVKLNIEEGNGEWKAEPHFYPIVTDNKRTGFNVRPVDEKELNLLYGELVKRTDNSNGFITIYNKCKDRHGYCYLVDSRGESNNLGKLILERTNISDVKFKDIRLVSSYIEQLDKFHHAADTKLFDIYEGLLKSRIVRRNNHIGNILLGEIGKSIKKEYFSHSSIRLFGKRKTEVKKAFSFREIMIEKAATRRLGYPEYAWKLDRKDTAYRFADEIGLRRPQNDLKIYKLSEIGESCGPIVIKPVHATGSRGVYLVFDKKTILSAREGIFLENWAELIKKINRELENAAKGKNTLRKDEWMLEELIISPKGKPNPSNNLKFFTFYGKVLLVLETNPLYNKKYCYWDADMNFVKTGRFDDSVFEGSGFSREDLDIAVTTSLQIPTPFVRLDMLKGNDGLVLGEITPRTGQFHLFNVEYDRKFGEAYRSAEANIVKDLLNGKKFRAFTNVFDV